MCANIKEESILCIIEEKRIYKAILTFLRIIFTFIHAKN